MPADPRLLALPALRELAEERAGDLLDEIRRQRGMMSDHTEGAVIEAVLTLLADLTRPASRDAVARLVAEAVGLECGATAPGLFRLVDPEPVWWLDCITGDEDDDIARAAFHASAVVRATAFPQRCIPGISAVTDPAEALTLIAIAVLGA